MSARAHSLLHVCPSNFKKLTTAFWWYTTLAVIAFVFIWSPQVFYLSGRHRFHFSVEPRCALEVPSEFSEIGFVVGPGIEDMPPLTRKPLLARITAEDCLALNVVNTSWDDTAGLCTVLLEFQSLDSNSVRRLTVSMAQSMEYGVNSLRTCSLLQHPRTRSHWLFEDLCVRGQNVSVIKDWRECIGETDTYLRGRPAFGVKGDASSWAWLHVLGGNLYFIFGVLQFRFPGHLHPRWHVFLGRLYASLNVLIYLSTILITLYTAPNIVRVALNVVLINNYWLWTLYAAIKAIRNGDKPSHRAWMLRNFSVAFAIVTGRYWGSILVFLLWPCYVNGTAATDGNILLASAAHAVMVEAFLKAEAMIKGSGSLNSKMNEKAQ